MSVAIAWEDGEPDWVVKLGPQMNMLRETISAGANTKGLTHKVQNNKFGCSLERR